MSKISVTTIAGLTSGGDANKVKIESGDTLEVVSNATVGGTLGVTGATTLGGNTDITGNTSITGDTATLTLTDSSSHSANTGPAISFFSKDSGGTSREVAKIVGESHSGANEGNLALQTRNGGTLETKWKLFKNGNFIPSNSAYGIVLGNTTSTDANLLDDYEEGTFTATLVATGSTFQYTYRTGSYTKIGNTVYFNLYIQLDGGGNSFVGNAVTITGLPFTSNSSANNNFRYYVHGRYLNVDGANYYYVTANLANGSAGLSLNQAGDNVPNKALPATYLSSSSGQLFINGHYFVS